jgi:site-specific DNA-methyltransferase (adenine-specific)
MTPYYDQDGITIYCGDALTILPTLDVRVQAVITDPPYASGARTEAAKKTSGAMVRGARWASKPIENDQMTTTGYVWLMREAAFACRPLLADGASVLVFTDWRQWPNLVGALESTNLRVNGMVVWDKRDFAMGWGFRNQHELIAHASLGTPQIGNHSIGNVLQVAREANDDHPSPKPVTLIQRLVEVVTERGDLVLDPFMGAGSTLRAGINLGRRAIGIEIEERYCEIAVKRLAQGVLL